MLDARLQPEPARPERQAHVDRGRGGRWFGRWVPEYRRLIMQSLDLLEYLHKLHVELSVFQVKPGALLVSLQITKERPRLREYADIQENLRVTAGKLTAGELTLEAALKEIDAGTNRILGK